MRTSRFQPLLLVALLGLFGCDAGEDPGIEPATEIAPGEPVPPVEPAPGTGDATGTASLGVAESPEHGTYLTDASGRALYLLEQEEMGTVTCYDACAEAWPPLLAPQGSPTAGATPIQQDLIGTVERRDGTMQVTYGGHALYYYAEDAGPGQTTGQDVTDQWGEWYLVSPQGEQIEAEASGS